MADDETTTPDEAPPVTDAPPTADAAAEGQLDLSQIRVETLMLQVASELLSIGAGQLGMVPEMINGGDAVQASLAITGADALIQAFLLVLPEGAPVPQPVEELRRAVAELQLAFADAVQLPEGARPPAAAAPPPPKAEPPRPKICTPGGDV